MDPRADTYEEGIVAEDSIYGPVDGAGRRFVVRIASSLLMLASFALVLLIGAGAVALVAYGLFRT